MPSITGTLSASGDSAALVSPTSPQFVRVWSLSIMGGSSNVVTLKTGSTVKYTVDCPSGDVGGVSANGGHEPLFTGLPGEALVINLSGANSVAYNVHYSIGG